MLTCNQVGVSWVHREGAECWAYYIWCERVTAAFVYNNGTYTRGTYARGVYASAKVCE
jgi:hypothetical protein